MTLIALLVAATVLLYVLRSHPSRGLGRLASPDSTALFMLVAIFAVRPLFADRLDDGFYGYALDAPSVERAIAIGATCIGAFGLGVFFATARPAKQVKLAALPPRARRRTTITAGGTLLVTIAAVAIHLAALLMFAGWRTVTALPGGRSAEASTGLPEIIFVLPLAGSISVSLFLLARGGTPIKRGEALTLLACVAISLVMVSALGTRRFMIPAILMPICAALIRRPAKLRLWHLTVGFVGLLFVAIVPMVRSAGARLPGENLLTATLRYASEQGIEGILEPIFAAYDTEMLDYIALTSSRIHAGWLSFGLGRGTLLEFILRPVPSSRLSQRAWSDEVLINLWGGAGCGDTYCPVASVAGVTYFDGGFPLVIVGSFAFGFGLRWLATRWVYNRHLGDFRATVVAIASSFALVAARTNTVHATWWCIYTLIIAWLIYRVFSDRVNAGRPRGVDRESVHLAALARMPQ